MYTVPKDSKLTVDLIKGAIEYNEEKRTQYNKLENYYLGEHDILTRKKPPTTKNNQLVINHAKYITDIHIGYLLGNPVEYQATEGDDISLIEEQFKKQSMADIDHEIAKDISIFGIQYELVYNVDNDIRSKDIDVRNAVCVYDDTVEHNKLFGIIYSKSTEKDKYEAVQVYDKIAEYDCEKGGIIVVGKSKPHKFGLVPLVEYKNNTEYQGDFVQVISLIDAYNLLQSDRVNDKEQLVEAILVGYGVKLEKKQLRDLRINRTIFGLDADSKLEYLTKSLDEEQIDVLRKVIQDDIHKISQTPNMSDENFVGNSSGVALRYKLLAFEQSVSNTERYFERGLLERFELYNNYLRSIGKMKDIPIYNIDVVFKRNLPQNDYETSSMINNLTDLVDDEALIGELSFIRNAKKTIDKKAKEDKAKAKLEIKEFGTPLPTKEDKLEEEDKE